MASAYLKVEPTYSRKTVEARAPAVHQGADRGRPG